MNENFFNNKIETSKLKNRLSICLLSEISNKKFSQIVKFN